MNIRQIENGDHNGPFILKFKEKGGVVKTTRKFESKIKLLNFVNHIEPTHDYSIEI